MIRVELNQRDFDETGSYRTIAALTVADDGTYQFEGEAAEFPTNLHVLTTDETDGLRPVRFEDDPATWARNLDTLLRTGYLVPVITHDDNEAAEDEN